jgi:hypothetical protein
MSTIKPIKEWRNVLLDTSVIIDYFKTPSRFGNNPLEQKRIENTQKLIHYLSPPTAEPEIRRTFLISAITIAELIKSPESDSTVRTIINLFRGADVMLLDFTIDHAEWLLKCLSDILPEGQKHQLFKQLERDLKTNGFSWARQWISDDLKILATAGCQKRLDVVLTADGRTFLTLAQKMGVPCLLTSNLPKDLFDDLNIDAAFNS